MSYTTVAELRSALGVGTLYADATLQSVCDAADNVLIPFLWSNTTPIIGHSNTANTGTSYFDMVVDEVFYVGQVLNITGCGAKHNGNKTLTSVSGREVSYAITGNNNAVTPFHPINPYGTAAADTYVDYSLIPAIQEASLMIAISIWGSRQSNSGAAMSPDGSMSSIYAMSNQLISRVRGLLAPYLDPRSMVG